MPKQHYYTNTLQPVQPDKTTLRRTLRALRQAVVQGTNVVQSDSPAPRNPSDYGSIYSGATGTAMAFLRLEHQKSSLVDDDDDDDDDDGGQDTSYLPDFAQLAQQRTLPARNAPDRRRHAPSPGRISPIGSSSLSTLIVRILAACQDPSRRPIPGDDIGALDGVVQHALGLGHVAAGSSAAGERSGVDEVLYGRAGLLWAVLSISGYVGKGDEDGDGDGELWRALRPVCEAVPRLVDVIVDAGKRGARDFVAVYGARDAFPLMWLYKDERYSLGSMHGIAGILTVLLSSPPSALTTHLPFVAATVTRLCQISIANNGHLPTSIPPRSAPSSSPLVQICHGAPGLLVLLATARMQPHLRANFWQPLWDDALRLSAARVWDEGLLVKGGGLCHGLCGNAWALLVVHGALEVDIERGGLASGGAATQTQDASDGFLARALALLLLARECPPYSAAVGVSSSLGFRVPDRPYSLFEGLAGELCAWAEACVAVQTRLCKLGLGRGPGSVREFDRRQLGFPGLGCPVHLVRDT